MSPTLWSITRGRSRCSWGGVALALIVVKTLGSRHLGAPETTRLRLTAPAVPEEMNESAERAAWTAKYARVRSAATLEKIVLVGLLSVIFGYVLPDYEGSKLNLFIGVGIVVAVNAAFTIIASRRLWTVESAVAGFFGRLAFNVAFVLVSDQLLRSNSGDLDFIDTFFFLSMISLITSLHDRYRPVHAVRKRQAPLPETDESEMTPGR